MSKESQGYNGLRVFYFRILYQSVGVDHIRLGPVTLEVQGIVKGRYEARRVFVDDKCAANQRENSDQDQHHYQTCVATAGVRTSFSLCGTYSKKTSRIIKNLPFLRTVLKIVRLKKNKKKNLPPDETESESGTV